MILRQFLHSDPVAASYFLGCGGRGVAAVVDPVGDVAPYLRIAKETGTRIRYAIDTHVHADHISAGRALADAAHAEYVLFADAKVTFPYDSTPMSAKPSWRPPGSIKARQRISARRAVDSRPCSSSESVSRRDKQLCAPSREGIEANATYAAPFA